MRKAHPVRLVAAFAMALMNAIIGGPALASPVVYLGQVTRIDYPDGEIEYFGYDAGEQPEWHRGRDGRYTELTRDTLHRVTQVDYPAVAPYAAISLTTQFDEFGRVSQTSDGNGTSRYTFDDLNRLTTATPAVGQGVSYTYTPDTFLKRWSTTVSLAGVAGSWVFREDNKGRVAQITNPFNQTTNRQFDPDGKLLSESRANGTVTNYGYTTRDTLASIQHLLSNGANLDTLTYSHTDPYNGLYDPTTRVHQETDSGGRNHSFQHLSRSYELSREDHPDFGTLTYMQDGHGNFTRRTLNGVNTYFSYDVHNKLLWVNTTNAAPTTGQASPYRKYTYNANAEPTTIERRDTTASPVITDTLEWDGRGKLRKVVSGGTTVYTATYNGAGDRVQSVQNGTTHTYSYGAGLLHDSAASTVYTPGVSHRQNGIDSYYHQDWIGSTRYTTDATGLTSPAAQRWDAYGNLTANAGGHGGALRWVGGAGYKSDAPLGLNLLGARCYDPAVGRFLNADPIGIAGGINQFAYCGGDPVNAIDPSGNFVVGAAAGATATSTVGVQTTYLVGTGAAAGGGGAAGGAAIAAAPLAIIAAGVGSSVDLVRYVRTGKNSGKWSPTGIGDDLGQAIGGALFPDPKYGAAPGFYARWSVDRSRGTLNAADAGCGGGGGGGGGKPPTTSGAPFEGDGEYWRVIGQAEYQDLMKTGRFNPSPSGSGSKYFWDSLESAQRYANLVRKWDPNPVIVNTTARPGLMNGPITMDGMPGYTIPNGSLGQLSYPTVMMRW